MRRLFMFILTLILMLSFTLCDIAKGQSKSVKDLFEEPARSADNNTKTSAEAKTNYGSERSGSIAEVNNIKISTDDFYRVLYASAGARILKQFVSFELAKQMAKSQNVSPRQIDFDLELRNVVNEISPNKDDNGKKLSYDDKLRILEVYLKALVKKKIIISDDMVEAEFVRAYGTKRRIRGIVIADPKLAIELFNRLQKNEDFATLASKYSIDFNSAPVGGQMGEITKHDPRVADIISETAFELKIGDFSSPIRSSNKQWIIKVDSESPAAKVSLDKVRDELIAELYHREEIAMMTALDDELFKEAKIRIYDNLLSQEFRQQSKRNQSDN
jgi:foldase protein PrsA